MNILMLTANDPAGMGIAFTKAVNAFSNHTCRLITTETRYNFGFEQDIHVPDLTTRIKSGYTNSADLTKSDEIRDLLKKADIFHFHILSDENMNIGPFIVKDFIKGKSILHHHHGHPYFQKNPQHYREKYRELKRRVIVSTPDLLRLLPEAAWIPNIVPIHNPIYMPDQERKRNGTVIVGHSPTRQDLKKTDVFKAVMDRIISKNDQVQKRIIINALHKTCLDLKRGCDIFFDQLGPSFGVSSLEALSQGIPTIARLDSLNLHKIEEFTGTAENPWVIAENERDLEDGIDSLVRSPSLRDSKGRSSRNFMESYWNEERVLGRLFKVYRRL